MTAKTAAPKLPSFPAARDGLGWSRAQGEWALERVLIADDHPMVRDGLRAVIAIAFEQCDIFEAATIDEAAAVIDREGDLDLVLLDLNMPGSSGFSGLMRLREAFPSQPIVVISAAQDSHLVHGAIAHGAAGFIPKSLKRTAIAEALKTVVSGDIFIPADIAHASTGDDETTLIWQRINSLTPQQRVVLGLIVAGKLNKQIAYELDVSMTTVKAHVSAILAKLNVFSRTQAVILANRVNFTAEPIRVRD